MREAQERRATFLRKIEETASLTERYAADRAAAIKENLRRDDEGRIRLQEQERIRRLSEDEWDGPPLDQAVATVASFSDVLDLVLERHEVNRKELLSASRKRYLVEARASACYLGSRMGFSLPTLGKMLGGRDHTTVLHGKHVAEDILSGKRQSGVDMSWLPNVAVRVRQK